MAQRKAITRELVARYRRAPKKAKGVMLDELCALTGWSRDHARRALHQARGEPTPKNTPQRRLIYDEEVMVALKRLWAVMDAPCGKRLAPFMTELIRALERTGELEVSPQVRSKLEHISAATIDRRLAGERRRLKIRGRSGTKPGTLLKSQIPIRTFSEWDERCPGFVEIDLVAHDGGNSKGQYCQTLDVTDISTGWTEPRAVRNKAQRWVFEALMDIGGALPFPLLGIDSDNGSEFINDELMGYCASHEITFTRSRPYRKNDSCFIEQKNWSVVRQAVGYGRYDSSAELEALNELYGHLRLFVNFFSPQMRLIEKTRSGARVTRRYDRAQTPYQRVMADSRIDPKVKFALTFQYHELNPIKIRRDILACQDKLLELARAKHPQPTRASKEVKSPEPSRASSVRQRSTPSRAS